MTVTDSLLSIESALLRLGRTQVLEALRPGLSAAAVRQLLSGSRMESAASLEELYGWHDGTGLPADGIVDGIEIFPGFYFLSVEGALAERSRYVEQAAWPASWLPLLADGGGYFYLAEVDGQDDPVVRRWEFDEPDAPVVAFESVAALAATLEAAYERQIIAVDSRGYLDMDDRQFAALAAELNPNAADAWTQERPTEDLL